MGLPGAGRGTPSPAPCPIPSPTTNEVGAQKKFGSPGNCRLWTRAWPQCCCSLGSQTNLFLAASLEPFCCRIREITILRIICNLCLHWNMSTTYLYQWPLDENPCFCFLNLKPLDNLYSKREEDENRRM